MKPVSLSEENDQSPRINLQSHLIFTKIFFIFLCATSFYSVLGHPDFSTSLLQTCWLHGRCSLFSIWGIKARASHWPGGGSSTGLPLPWTCSPKYRAIFLKLRYWHSRDVLAPRITTPRPPLTHIGPLSQWGVFPASLAYTPCIPWLLPWRMIDVVIGLFCINWADCVFSVFEFMYVMNYVCWFTLLNHLSVCGMESVIV